MIQKIKQVVKWIRDTYQSTAENRLQMLLFMGFMLIPLFGMTALFIYEFFFVLK